MNQIKYKEVQLKDVSDEYNKLCIDKLNKMGEEGWELVFVSGGRVIFKRSSGRIEYIEKPTEIEILTELEEKQAYIYKKIATLPEIKYISMKYQSGDRISLEIKNVFEKTNLISDVLLYGSKELGISIIPLYSNVKNYNEFENVLFIELLNPVKSLSRKSYDDSVRSLMEGVISLEIQF